MILLLLLLNHNINSLTGGRIGKNFKSVIFQFMSIIQFLNTTNEIPLRCMSQHPIDEIQYRLRQWLGAIRHQAITWANVDPDLSYGVARPDWVNKCCFVTLWGIPKYNELWSIILRQTSYQVTVYYMFSKYRKISNIRHIKSQNLNDPRLVLQFSLPNPLKPGVKSRMKM